MPRLDVDLHEDLPRRVEQFCVLPGGVARAEFRADDEDQIGLAEAGIRRRRAERTEHAERQRMGLGKAALAGGGRRDRHPRGLGKRAQLVVGLRDAHPVAGDDDRALGGKDALGRGRDLRRIGRRRGGGR